VPDRLEVQSFARGFHLVHQAELPVYVSVDAVLHAVAALHTPLVTHLEVERVAPLLRRTLARMHEALPVAARAWPEAIGADVDTVLTVARSLLERDSGVVDGALGASAAAREFVEAVRASNRAGTRSMFGRQRTMDFTVYDPVALGLSADAATRTPTLLRVRRAMTWLARVELNLLTRGCRSSHPGPDIDTRETPREVLAALALTELATEPDTRDALTRIDQVLSIVHGARGDLSLPQVAVMRDIVRITDIGAADTLERFASIVRNQPSRVQGTHPLPDGVTELPVVASVLGARLAPGHLLPHALVHPAVPSRSAATAAEAAYVLGADRARAWLDEPYAAHTSLERVVDHLRNVVPEVYGDASLLGSWFRAITALSEAPSGRTPGFMATTAFGDLRVNSTLAAYGEYLHRNDRVPADDASPQGCEIPSGWVDPVPTVYALLERYAERAIALVRSTSAWAPEAHPNDAALLRVLDNLSRVARGLHQIAEDELAGRQLGELQIRFLSMVAESTGDDTSHGAHYSGWYFSLFLAPEIALARSEFAAHWGAARGARQSTWIGAATPRLGLFVIDHGGLPFVAAGPVARAWELAANTGTASARALALATSQGRAPWSASWLVSAEREPPLAVTLLAPHQGNARYAFARARERTALTLELLDTHGLPITATTRTVSARTVTRLLLTTVPNPTEVHNRSVRHIDHTQRSAQATALRVRAGGFVREWPLPASGALHIHLGGEAAVDVREVAVPRRPL
jgi:hypothetical protein